MSEKTLEENAETLRIDLACLANLPPDALDLSLILAYGRAVAEREREECAKAACAMCSDGDELHFGIPPGSPTTVASRWFHINSNPLPSEDSWDYCRSRNIRARGHQNEREG